MKTQIGLAVSFCSNCHHQHQSNQCWHSHKRKFTGRLSVFDYTKLLPSSPRLRTPNKRGFLRTLLKELSPVKVSLRVCALTMALCCESMRYPENRRPASRKVRWENDRVIVFVNDLKWTVIHWWCQYADWNVYMDVFYVFSLWSSMCCLFQKTSGMWSSIRSLPKP